MRLLCAFVVIWLTVSMIPSHTDQIPSSVGLRPIDGNTQAHTFTIASSSFPGPNIDIAGEAAPDRQRAETTVTVDPANPSIIVAGAQDYSLKAVGQHRWHGYYRSTDGGQTWTSALLPGFPGDTSPLGTVSPLRRFNATSDPVMAFDRSGNLYYTGIAFNAVSPTQVSSLTAFVAKYVNHGADYSSVTLISGVSFADKPWIAVDTSGGVSDGNVYLAFDAIVGKSIATVFTRSTNGGVTFSAPIPVPAGGIGDLPGVTVDSRGNVYVSTLGNTAKTSKTIQVSKLTNGGSILAGTTIGANITPTPSPLPGGSFRSGTIPQIASDGNGVYLVWDDFGTGDSDVLLARSTDGGLSWGSPVRVNDVTTGEQFFPTVTASGGVLSVAWYDSRFNTGTVMTILDVFYAQSTDAGATFSSNLRVTSTSFDPNTVLRTDSPNPNQPFIGDYIGIAASPTAAHPVWADNRNACDTVDPSFGCLDQDAFSATISQQTTVPVSFTSSLDSSRVTTSGGLTVNGRNLTISGSLTVTAVDATSGTITFSKTYTITSLPLSQVGGSLQTGFVLDAAVLPYSLSSDIAVRLQGSSVSVTSLLTRELDLNADGVVSIIDVGTVASAYGTVLGDARYDPRVDFDANGVINILDLSMIATYFGDHAFR